MENRAATIDDEEPEKRPVKLKRFFIGLTALTLILAAAESYHIFKSLPEGIPYAGELKRAPEVRFLSDTTFVDEQGNRHVRQEIFDEVFNMIAGAERLLVLDMFLFNGFQGPKPERTRALSSEIVAALIKRKSEAPRLRAVLITDPINTVYGGMRSEQLDSLRAGGIEVVETKLPPLRDSNPLYSALWRPFFRPMGNSNEGGKFRNPFGEGRVTLRSWLSMLNFKANHRKAVLADSPTAPGGWAALVTSGNPHDASSAHGNVAVWFTGPAVVDLLRSELAVYRYSTGRSIDMPVNPPAFRTYTTRLAVLTESAIKTALLESTERAGRGDRIMVSVFYLSDRDVIRELREAAVRGAAVRVLLDPNIDAFGFEKNGIPNRQTGAELNASGVAVRWCDTHGEQCHAKMLLADYRDGTSRLLAGSANFTRRNLRDLNLESDVLVEGPSTASVFIDARRYFELVWKNRPGETYSADYAKYAENSLYKDYLYRFMEFTGLCTF